jgi:hypothetical protein
MKYCSLTYFTKPLMMGAIAYLIGIAFLQKVVIRIPVGFYFIKEMIGLIQMDWVLTKSQTLINN